jgi:hypothetical protein
MVLMIRRGLRSTFPMFFNYMGLNTVATFVGLGIYLFAFREYFYVYWALSTVLMIVSFAVIYEVFADLLKPFSAIVDLGKMLFFWAAMFLLVAGVLTALVTAGPSPRKLTAVVDLCDRCLHLMQCGLLMLVVLFEKRLSFSWRSSSMVIAVGLGVTAAVDLIVSYAQNLAPALARQWDMVNSFFFIASLLYWAIGLRRQAATKTANPTPSRLILQRWNEALISYGYGEAAVASGRVESFLPGIEKTVDRVLARKIAN